MSRYNRVYSEDDSSDSDGYGTADNSSSDEENRRNSRSRSRHRRQSSRETTNHRESQQEVAGRRRSQRSRSRRNRRHGRRGRQRHRRERRENQDDSWYFPEEQSGQPIDPVIATDNQSRENIIAANNSWLQTLAITPQTQGAYINIPIDISPLANTNNVAHVMRWNDNNRTVTITPRLSQANPSSEGPISLRENRSESRSPTRQPSAVTQYQTVPTNQSSRQDQSAGQTQRLPVSSNQDLNFNLAQQLQNRNRMPDQQHQGASRIQIGATAEAVSYGQLTTPRADEQQSSWDTALSLDAWGGQRRDQHSLLNTSTSENRRSTGSGQGRVVRRNFNRDGQQRHHIRPGYSNEFNAESTSNQRRRATVAITNSLEYNNQHHSEETLLPQTETSTTTLADQPGNSTHEDEDYPYARFDEAFRRQEERNEWRHSRRRRQERRQRRAAENRRQNRTRATDSNLSVTAAAARSNTVNIAPNTDRNAAPNLFIPVPPPLPPRDWVPPARLDNEWQDAPNYNIIHPAALQQANHRSEARIDEFWPETRNDYRAVGGLDDKDMRHYDEYSDQIESLLRSYQDPAESNTALGEFLSRVTARAGRVIISRIKTRITKQYFRRGDFQIALADFRNLNPDHARQVPGVGFTGTINNMYRVTVKQNSSFGKPTFEIRPMNKKVRRKKVHICYKLRYFNAREKMTRTRAPRPTSTTV